MTDDEVVQAVRERQLLREFDRATEMRRQLLAQLALVDKVRSDLITAMRATIDEQADGPMFVLPPEPRPPAADGLDEMTRRDLYRLATDRQIAGRSGMNRQQLIDALRTEEVTGDGDTR